jgi:site-specific DNA-methyltransferase (adenine-specific)
MTLLQGDCLELMKNVPDKSIDLILCDLPYGTTRNKWDEVIPFDKLWAQYNRIIKDNGAIVLFSQMPFGANLIMSNPKMFRYEWIWEKEQGTGFLNAKKMPLKKHENILVFYKHLPTYNPQGLIELEAPVHYKGSITKSGSNYGNASKDYKQTHSNYPTDIIEFNRDKGLHPTQKPVALLEYLIKTYTNEGDVVLDNCMGSGSTGVACLNTNREFIGMELDENYYKIACERLGA